MMDYASRLTRSLRGLPPPAGGGPRAGRNAAKMPPETIGNEGFQFGVVNPAHQPLADDLNFWLSGGFTGPDAPGARGPMQSIAKKGRR
jgi:hypothetical protein